MAPEFVHLHVHSEFSLLDGLGRVNDLVKHAASLGQKAMALTDHGTMHGVIDFFRACKKEGIKPIVGVEAYLTKHGRPMEGRDATLDKARHHLLLLAENEIGYRNLLKVCTHAQLEGYYYRPRIDKAFLEKHAQGLICTSGCLASEIPHLLSQGREREAVERVHWYRDVFGPGRYYLELQEHSIPELDQVNRQLIEFSRQYDLPLLATNDVHYVKSRDANPHDVLLCIQTTAAMTAKERLRMSDGSYYVRSAEEMDKLFGAYPGALSNSLLIADMCNVDVEDRNYHLPPFPMPAGHDYESYLRHLAETGLRQRYDGRADDPAVRRRFEHELKVIHEMGFDVYFLIVGDLCRYARERGIWYNVRGSGAGSVVAYVTGITNLDPLPNNLIFERFLNPGRVSMPDFDLDFPDDQREEMIRYTIGRYGEDQVAQIVTFGRMKARAAVRDVGRVMEIPLSEVDRVAKMIPNIPGKPVSIKEALEQIPDLKQSYDEQAQVRELLETASLIEGVARHASIHAAAVIVADKPLIHYTPLMRPQKSAITKMVTQYEFPVLESIGLLKVDFLGLSTLSVMREATRLIAERHGVRYTLDNIPLDDVESYKLLASGEVAGVFQVEGAGMRRVLTEMQPHEFNNIVAAISLYRPGPMDFIPEYIACLHGRKKPEYVHPALEPILGETYGVCVSGDAIVFDARTGTPHRMDALGEVEDLWVQGVDANLRPAIGRVTHFIVNGQKEVWQVTLRNGAQIKVTPDHKLLTETGWKPLRELTIGNFVATPHALVTQTGHYDQRKLRVLAYLIADGDIGNLAAVNFVSKDPILLDEYRKCLKAFDNPRTAEISQVRNVTRIGVAKDQVVRYHEPNDLLKWLRSLGLKHERGGCRSSEKFVPPFIFELCSDDIAWFVASLWDCDGYVSSKFCHYKTISRRLAFDVQSLLLRLGIPSTIYTAHSQGLTSYQITVFESEPFSRMVQIHMVSRKREVLLQSRGSSTIERSLFVADVESATNASKRRLESDYGIDRQHFSPRGARRERIPQRVVADVTDALHLEKTQRLLQINWQEIVAIEPAGVEPVYDITVEGLHNFLANNIVVHNCIYQEQIIQLLTLVAGYTAGEADLVRRAISKKKADVIEKERAKFAQGTARTSGLTHEEADKIWDALEGFARYGFNRAHAADYAVICVQTAYLKAHYPLEFMAAQLLVERDKSDKVTNFITECRRMGIEVLSPALNASGLDFTIEQRPADTPPPVGHDTHIAYHFPIPRGAAIRFGLAAVKNVGEGPVETILEARQAGGPFRSLEDLCQRVDLRKVTRRPLECLIKVGALDDFGERAQLLAAVDGMMGESAAAHEAKEVGQMSIFDLFSGKSSGAGHAMTKIRLPKVDAAKSRERLTWEKELLGVYASSHPLQQITVDVSDLVTCQCGAVDATRAGQSLLLIGMLTEIKQIVTKKGEPMGFCTLEDLGGSVELTIFPRTYAEVRDRLALEKVVLVRGKVDARDGGRVSIWVDVVQDYVDRAKILLDGAAVRPPSQASRATSATGNGKVYDAQFGPSRPDAAAPLPREKTGSGGPIAGAWYNFGDAGGDEEDDDDMPALLMTDDDDDDNGWQAAPEPTAPLGSQEIAYTSAPLAVFNGKETAPTLAAAAPQAPHSVPHTMAAAPAVTAAPVRVIADAPMTLYDGGRELADAATEAPPLRKVHVTVLRSSSAEEDKRRLGQIYDVMRRHRDAQSRDHFVLYLTQGAQRMMLDFPNDPTTCSPALQAELARIVGWDGLRVESV